MVTGIRQLVVIHGTKEGTQDTQDITFHMPIVCAISRFYCGGLSFGGGLGRACLAGEFAREVVREAYWVVSHRCTFKCWCRLTVPSIFPFCPVFFLLTSLILSKVGKRKRDISA